MEGFLLLALLKCGNSISKVLNGGVLLVVAYLNAWKWYFYFKYTMWILLPPWSRNAAHCSPRLNAVAGPCALWGAAPGFSFKQSSWTHFIPLKLSSSSTSNKETSHQNPQSPAPHPATFSHEEGTVRPLRGTFTRGLSVATFIRNVSQQERVFHITCNWLISLNKRM